MRMILFCLPDQSLNSNSSMIYFDFFHCFFSLHFFNILLQKLIFSIKLIWILSLLAMIEKKKLSAKISDKRMNVEDSKL